MKKIFYSNLLVFMLVLIGCSDETPTYTRAELETFLIRDCKEVTYIFMDEGLEYSFDFRKTSNGNVGEYHRWLLTNNKYEYKKCDFIWEVEPDGNGGIVTMAFEEEGVRIRVRMLLVEEEYTVINIENDVVKETKATEILWELDFKPKNDPFN